MPHQTLIALLDLGIAGTYVLSAAIIVALVLLGIAFLGTDAPRYRCSVCSATLPTWDLLVAHEAELGHRPCGPGRHHPSCALRSAS